MTFFIFLDKIILSKKTEISPSFHNFKITKDLNTYLILTFCPLTIRDVTSLADFKSSSSAFNF